MRGSKSVTAAGQQQKKNVDNGKKSAKVAWTKRYKVGERNRVSTMG